ncbi:MAG: hypothetical protein WCH75_18555, partial [Candidatus Binatia bacterium]
MILCNVRGQATTLIFLTEAATFTRKSLRYRHKWGYHSCFDDMKKRIHGTNSLKTLERDLKIASSILEWEMGDVWGHIGVR